MVLGIFACYVFTILVLVIRCIIQGIFLVCYGELEEETENERKMRQYSVLDKPDLSEKISSNIIISNI